MGFGGETRVLVCNIDITLHTKLSTFKPLQIHNQLSFQRFKSDH